jgi:DNA-binding NarL/FixJ family response regulator
MPQADPDTVISCRSIRSHKPCAPRALVLTMYDDDDVIVLAALREGAVRLHTQGAGPDQIVAAVARGEALFGAGIAASKLQHFGHGRLHRPFASGA